MPDANPDAVKLLSDDEIAEIEARDTTRLRGSTDHLDRIVLSVAERDALCATVRALREKLAELRIALEPFAVLDVEAFSHLRDQSNDREIYKMNDTVITVGDVRRARALLQQE